ncbi:MAG: N-acetylmuramoyl-L-alanine amidase [Muribaculaceae bacterium]|nr:N-acetylmuramoyl-L-alanine amidase [Muribaculaceae bacterium]
MKILIDNGHGVTTPGKRAPKPIAGVQLFEYKYAREIASEVVKNLKMQGYDAILLVPEAADISLGQRCARANAWCDTKGTKNVCLVSIHLNAAGNGADWAKGRGWEAWTSPGQTMGDRLAESLYDAAQKHLPTGTPIRTDMTDGDRDKEARFQILTGTRCAACLTENLFMDNLEDAKYLLSDTGRKAITDLHVDGIIRYVKSLET